MENRMITELVVKYISGLANDEEKKKVLDWIDLSDDNKKFYSELKNYWVLENLNSFGDKAEPKRNTGFNLMVIYRIAAILVVTVSVFGAYLLFKDKEEETIKQTLTSFEYIVNTGVKGIVNLPDGSKVWLNSASSIKCPEKFSVDKREIELDGEGFFEVIPNKNWPMYVKTSKGCTVKVTGTSFNLSSYSNDNKLIVTLISGEITLLQENNKNEIKLNPTEEVVITDTNKEALVKSANIEYNTAWKQGYLLFDNTPMDEVVRKIERWYGVSFIIKDTSILDYRFTANFKSESISQVLEILKLSSNIRFQIDETKITLTKI